MPSEMQCFVFAYTVLRISEVKSFFVNLNQSVVHNQVRVVHNQVRFVKGGATEQPVLTKDANLHPIITITLPLNHRLDSKAC
jgi:hypothetical protein